MKREVNRVEPRTSYLERVRARRPTGDAVSDTVYVSGFSAVRPRNRADSEATFERQTELVRALCLEVAGSVVDGTSPKVQRLLYIRREVRPRQRRVHSLFPQGPVRAHFIKVPAWFGPFEIEFDFIAVETK